ncbi:hypothetical protein FRC17_006561 [Serendipita sp. 399]|nr:hypothetical protein FRC17_006561 [Serendipita sp. 399]
MGGLVEPSPDDPTSIHRPPIIVPLMGGCDPRARKEFSRSLVEKLDNVDRQVAKGLKKLDDAVTGYAFEMVDLPTNAYSMPPNSNSYPQEALDVEDDDDDNSLTELVKASLRPLDGSKLRIAHSTPSPHAMLRLVLECGIDLFDVPWVAEAADLGIALDFEFPARDGARERALETDEEDGQRSLIGHNLFDERFAQDLGPLGNSGACSSCWACKPTWVSERVIHSTLDGEQWEVSVDESGATLSSKGFSRAYLHHLLHTHEMSAYALLHLHNLAIADSFFANLRRVLASEGEERFKEEVIRFYQAYELPEQLFDEARARWKEVEDSRGKGRLKREREALSRINGTIDSTLPVVSPESEGLNDDGELTPKASAVAVILEGVEDLTI